jgi:hypothetical protein
VTSHGFTSITLRNFYALQKYKVKKKQELQANVALNIPVAGFVNHKYSDLLGCYAMCTDKRRYLGKV